MFLKFLRKYSVAIEGENLSMDSQGNKLFGCFTTRYVTAPDVGAASKRAIDLAQKELVADGWRLAALGDRPTFTVGEIRQVALFNIFRAPGKGFTFYPMGS